jgi:aminopeptidase N
VRSKGNEIFLSFFISSSYLLLLSSRLLFSSTSYDLSIEPDLEAFTFTGTCVIEFAVTEYAKANEITLHAKELLFESAVMTTAGDTTSTIKAEQINVNVKNTTVTFVFAPESFLLPRKETDDTITLTILYKGFLNNQMAGFYRSSYADIEGNSKIMASTQFEALDARRAFPCVDEPAAKAVFHVTLTIPSHLVCFSNMPEESVETLTKTKKRVVFWDSPKMSTYLVAFCIGEFDFVQRQTKHGVLIKVYTPVGKSKQGEFALTCACDSLDAYDDFFDVRYPLPKLDMVAIPEFAMGGMYAVSMTRPRMYQ